MEYRKKWYEENIDKIREFKKLNPEIYRQNVKKVLDRINKIRFGGNRKDVLERDNFRCVICHLSNKQHKEIFNCSITIDHIDGNGRNSKNPNNKLDNLRTLCLVCHGERDCRRRKKNPVNILIAERRNLYKK